MPNFVYCRFCGAEYNARKGQHLCDTGQLRLIIQERATEDTFRVGEPLDEEIEERIRLIEAFWRNNPEHKSEVTTRLGS